MVLQHLLLCLEKKKMALSLKQILLHSKPKMMTVTTTFFPSIPLSTVNRRLHGGLLSLPPSPHLSPAVLPPHYTKQLVYFSSSSSSSSCTCRCSSSPISSSSSLSTTSIEVFNGGIGEFIVVNFYRFVYIEDPQVEVARHSSFVEGLDIHGRIYFNEQGINAQFSGPSEDALKYVEWIREDHRFADILVQISPSRHGHAFPRLKLRYKPSLVQFDLGAENLPLLEPSMRATPLTPVEWRKRLNALRSSDDTENDDQNKACIVLDVRNGYEWDIGHFHGAQRPEVDCFKSTSFGLSDAEVIDSDPLVNVDKERTDILMYCTGGIRCDVYSTILREKGFKNLYTLKGGVSHYLEKEGPEKWVGNLFVFDSRLSLPPSTFKPGVGTSNKAHDAAHNNYARCYICGSQVHELRHRNCANIDCNLLFLCCGNCVEDLTGCCCPKCTTAPRLRPVLSGHKRYEKWHVYRDGNSEQTSLSL